MPSSLPSGVVTCDVTFGADMDLLGTPITTSISVAVSHDLVWTATGQRLVSFPVVATAPSSASASIALPVVDQSGFTDGSGNAITMWTYVLTATYRSAGGNPRTLTKTWQPLTGQTSVDFDTIDNGSATSPTSGPIAVVTSFNGETGDVSYTPTGATGDVIAANNLSDLADAPTARTNLGLGDAAVRPVTYFATAAGLTAEVSARGVAEALLAPKASPALTGTPTAPTATAGTNSTQVATTAFTAAAITVAQALDLQKSANLSDVASAPTSRANIRVGLLGSAQCVAVTNVTTLSGLPIYDGYQLVNDDIVLLAGQATQSQNGPWQMPPSGSGAWVRPADYATGMTMRGRIIEVNGGNRWNQSIWVMASTATITVGTTATAWQCVSIPDPLGSDGLFLTNDGVNPLWSPLPVASVRAQNAAFRFSGGLSSGDVSEAWRVWDAAHLTRGPAVTMDQPSASDVLQVDIQYNSGSGWVSIFGTGPFPTVAQGNTIASSVTPTVSALPAGADLRVVILHAPPGPTTNPTAASFVANNNGNTGTVGVTSQAVTIPGTPATGDVVVLVIADSGSTTSMPSPWQQYASQNSSSAFSTTGTAPTTSNQLTVASPTGIAANQVISATNVPTGTTVLSITGSVVTMSNNSSAAVSGTVTFTPPIQSALSIWVAPWVTGMSTTVTLATSNPAAWWVGLLRGADATTPGNSIFQIAGRTDGNSPGAGGGVVNGAGITAAAAAADLVLVAAAVRYGSTSVGYTLSASGGPSGLASSANIVTSRSAATNVGLYVGLASAAASGAPVPAVTWTTSGGTGGGNASIADSTLTALIARPAGTSGPSVATVQLAVDN